MENGYPPHPSRRFFSGSAGGFTMIEVVMVLLLVALIIPTIFFLVGNVYKYVAKVSKTVDIRNDAINVFTLVRKDIQHADSVSVDPDNDGVKIYRPGDGIIRYYRESNKIMRSENGEAQVLSKHPLANSAWVKNKDIISVELTFSYRNLNSKKPSKFKIMDNFEIEK
ncbi:MAG: hypothetical protein K8T10_21515 [Candidatus Eremiobacteraeota bacterium]|nr:hypothetical protein [Candidatus Eremiobacteraeota bacterium]